MFTYFLVFKHSCRQKSWHISARIQTIVIFYNSFTYFHINDYLLRETPSHLAKILEQRMSLDRRRLEEGYLLYASLTTLEKYNLWEEVGAIAYDRNEMVELVTRVQCCFY